MKQWNYVKFVLPAITFVFILTVIPVITTICLSFTSFNIGNPSQTTFIGLLNYQSLFSDSRFLNSVRVTFLLIVFPVAFQLLFGLAVALALNEKLTGTHWIRLLFIAPSVLPPIVIGLMWKVFLIPQLGGLNYFLSVIGITGPDWLSAPFTALVAIMIASAWTGTSFVALMFLSALETIPGSYYEVAAINGASWGQMHWYVTFPMLRSITRVVVMFRILEALAIFPIIFVLTGGGPAGATEPINFYAYATGFNYLKVDYAATLIVVFFLLLLALSWPILRTMVKR